MICVVIHVVVSGLVGMCVSKLVSYVVARNPLSSPISYLHILWAQNIVDTSVLVLRGSCIGCLGVHSIW